MNRLYQTLLKSQKLEKPPIWIMRQAGRYLAEYREIRNQEKDFLSFCYNPKSACEVTLQPIRRFDFDAAIIFSDILTIPDAMGVDVKFVKGEGPKLGTISKISEIKNQNFDVLPSKLNAVYEAINLTRSKLNKDKDLIGFSGAPFTLACYMVEGGGSKNFAKTRQTAIADEEFFGQLIDLLTDFVQKHLELQIEAGANVVKIFDSWAGVLPPAQLEKWVISPTEKIVANLHQKYPQIPVICFPRGIGMSYRDFVFRVRSNAVAIDQTVDISWAKKTLQDDQNAVIQGNLDNVLLAFGSKDEIEQEVMRILEKFTDGNFVFNLGHGILPETPVENVEFLVKLVKGDG